MLNFRFLVFAAPMACSAAFAQSMDAHTHGLANLDVALEKNQLMLRFVSPAANIYGFEHDAMNARQREIVQSAMQLMEQPNWLIGDISSQCSLEHFELEAGVALTQAAEPAHDHEHAHEETAAAHDHDDGRGHEHEETSEAHDHEHRHEETAEAHEHNHETHAEVIAEYRLACGTLPGELAVAAFEHFPSLEEIEVQWISDSAQGGAELTAQQPRVVFNAR